MLTGEQTQAAENRKRNRGRMDLWLRSDSNVGYESPRPGVKVGVSDAAMENLIRGRGSLVLCGSKVGGSPRPQPRVRTAEGRDLLDKGKGQIMDKVLDVDGNRYYYSAREPRVPCDEGKENLRRSVNGTLANVMNVDANRGYSTARKEVRVPPDEGRDNCDYAKNGTMSKVLNVSVNRGYQSARPAPRVPTDESKSNEFKGRGTMNKVLNTRENLGYKSARPESRVKPEAEDIANMNKGTLGLVLQGKALGDPAPCPRVKPEAEDIAIKNKGSLTQMYHKYGRLPLSARPAPKVKGEAEDIYTRGTKGIVQNLMHKYGGLPTSPRPASRVKGDGNRYAKKNRGEMDTLLHGAKKTYKRNRPGTSKW